MLVWVPPGSSFSKLIIWMSKEKKIMYICAWSYCWCIEFIWGIYTDIVVSSVHINLLGNVAPLWHLRGILHFWYIYGINLFPVTWCWWCHQWQHCIYLVEMIVIIGHFVALLVLVQDQCMCHEQCHWYHVMLMPMASHDWKSNHVPHFNYLDVRSEMVLLMIPSVSLDFNASGNGITW